VNKQTATVGICSFILGWIVGAILLRPFNNASSSQNPALKNARTNEANTSKTAIGNIGSRYSSRESPGDQSNQWARKHRVSIGMQDWEIQEAVINNLRQIAAALDQFRLENGRPAQGIEDLVGSKGFLKTIQSVDGEDYSHLPLSGNSPLGVVTAGGIAVTITANGGHAPIEVPTEIAEVRSRAQDVRDSAIHAIDAYHEAHNGGEPPDEQALLPFFETTAGAADYAEYLEAKKRAGLKRLYSTDFTPR
jgi:hypothetical protein